MSGKVEIDFLTSSQDFFREAIDNALTTRHIVTNPPVKNYLVDLLNRYVFTENLFSETDVNSKKTTETLAEMYLKAASAERKTRIELLQKLGDTSLYISGFFGESLQRKIVDIDYYIEMGGTAYSTLSQCFSENSKAQMFEEISRKFIVFVDVLSFISNKSQADNNVNLLRIYEKYLRTGSDLAKDQILQKGLTLPDLNAKNSKQ